MVLTKHGKKWAFKKCLGKRVTWVSGVFFLRGSCYQLMK